MSEERSAEDAKAGSPDPSSAASEASTPEAPTSEASTPEASTSEAPAQPSAADALSESKSVESESAESTDSDSTAAESTGSESTAAESADTGSDDSESAGADAADAADESSSETPAQSARPKSIRKVVGQVVSDKMQKTVTVLVERKVKHPLYKKYIRRSTKLHAHDENDSCRIGDRISIVQCRPISKTKSWRVHEIIRRSK